MSKPSIKKRLPKAVFYYDTGRQLYWGQAASGTFIPLTERALARHLQLAGFSGAKLPDGRPSALDREMVRVQLDHSVSYVGPLAGYNRGLHQVGGRTILVTESPKLIEPVAGEFPLLTNILTGMLVDGDIDQRPYFFGWLKVALCCLRAGQFQPGQALVLAGPKDSFKSSLQNLITLLLGGRSAKPYRYMSGQTPFNRDLFEAEHLMIEDEVASTRIAHRRDFGAKIKEVTVNETNSLHAKGRDAITLRPFWRLTISVNEEPENLQILPPIDESLLDKMILLRVNRVPLPMTTATLSQRKVFWDALLAELPALMSFLLNYQIPSELESGRFGITHFHHPQLLAEIDALAPEIRLLNLIDLAIFNQIQQGAWQGTSEQLHHFLVGSFYGYLARELLDWPNATGSYLGRLARKRPERVAQARTTTLRSWVIHPPVRMTP